MGRVNAQPRDERWTLGKLSRTTNRVRVWDSRVPEGIVKQATIHLAISILKGMNVRHDHLPMHESSPANNYFP